MDSNELQTLMREKLENVPNKARRVIEYLLTNTREAAFRIEQQVEAFARLQAMVVTAFRTDAEVLLKVGGVEHCLAGRTLAPQAFGNRLLRTFGPLDLRRQ